MSRFAIVDAPQRSDEWREARMGRLTGSVAADMLATIKSGEAAARRDLRMQLVCERLTGVPQENGYVSAEMQRGVDLEPVAVAAYEASRSVLVRKSGFLALLDVPAGCSLDGHVGQFTGIIELKCPKSTTHWRYMQHGKVPADYVAQITHNLWVSGAQWCDFISFDDRFPPALQLFVVRVPRDEAAIAAYEKAALAFLAEVARDVDVAKTLMGTALQDAVA